MIVGYSYSNRKFSAAAIKHAFNYFSAFSEIRFNEDHGAPVIYRGSGPQVPGSVRVVFAPEEGILNNPGDSNLFVVEALDPIEKIIEKLSENVKLGPFAPKKIEPDNSIDESLCKIVRSFYKVLFNANIVPSSTKVSLWPDGHKFCIIVTHDVDMVGRSIPGSMKLLFNNDVPGGIRGLYDSVRAYLGLIKNPYDRFEDWIDLENRLGIKSTYFVFAGKRTNALDPKYKLNELKDTLELITSSGHELALHTGVNCNDGKFMKASKDSLSQACKTEIYGMRPHYLSAFTPGYWHSAAESGGRYTSCLGFDDDIGFYKGIDLPFMPFDANVDSPIDIVEIPIALMDCGLIGEAKANCDEIIQKGVDFMRKVEDSGGVIVLDWHQRTMYNYDYPGWGDVFKGLVEYARKKGAYFCTMGQAARNLKDKMARAD